MRLSRSMLTLCALASVSLGALRAFADSYKLVTLDFPPLEFENEKGEAMGAAVDIVRAVMTKLGHKTAVQVLPWTRSLNLTREGKADAIFTAYKNEEREAFLDYGHEVLMPQIVSLYTK